VSDLVSVRKEVKEEVKSITDASVKDSIKSKKLLYLFVKDLLPGASGSVLENKRKRDDEKVHSVKKYQKYLAYTYILLLDAGMIFYIFLFAISQTDANQAAWLQSFLLWLAADFFLVDPVSLLFINKNYVAGMIFVIRIMREHEMHLRTAISLFKRKQAYSNIVFIFPDCRFSDSCSDPNFSNE